MKKLALFDIDGVIHEGHLIFDIVQDSEKRGIIPFGVWKKILLEIEEYKSGRKNYKEAADSMLEAYAKSLSGLSYKDVFNHSYKYISNSKKKMFEYFPKILPELKKKYDISSIAEVMGGKFTGKVGLSLGGNKGIVSELINKYGREGSIAFGDSENDADMLKEVEYPFVFEANEKLTKICKENGWKSVNRGNAYKVLTDLI